MDSSLPKVTGTFPGSVSGTYLQVSVRSRSVANEFDSPPEIRYSVLYLLPKGHFAWFNYWSGYSYRRCAGMFTRNGADLHLLGRSSLLCDTPAQNYSHQPFERQVKILQEERRRFIMLGETEHLYIGWSIHIPFRGSAADLFPHSWDALQGWIDEFLKPVSVK